MLNHEILDLQVRQHMLEELAMDIQAGSLYLSPRLSARGLQDYPMLLEEAVRNHDDGWLENELRQNGRINATEQRRKPKGGYTIANVPITAAETMAEGEFNRFYIRGLCRDVLANGLLEVEVYRAKDVAHPRMESQQMIGRCLQAQALLDDLRTSQGVDTALGLPPGPNSGLSARRPR
jgi:hypothetical protein